MKDKADLIIKLLCGALVALVIYGFVMSFYR